ncbi:MAG TPA: CHAP domain-containing protein [Sporichthyaceae bacterium]|nr:CHAP domain-containing protein [Sporichthyaceae bacterium]
MRKRQRLAVLGLVSGLVAGGAALAIPADAVTGTRLCHGYDDCRSHGYSDHGYRANGGGSYWNMFTGHNCTNYVAFRLVQGGMSNLRPAADAGQSNARLSAYLWGLVYASRTDSSAKVGSVAWWGSGSAGSIGHVAYVERVDGDSITVSEDSSSGNDFDWKKITHAQGWPTGFIHFNDGHHVDSPLPSGGTPVGGGGTLGGHEAAGGAGGAFGGGDGASGGDVPAAVARGDFGGDVSGGPFGSGAFTGGRSSRGSGAWGPMAGNWAPTSSVPAAQRKARAKARAKAKPSTLGTARRSPTGSAPAGMFGPGGGGFGPM